MLFIDALGQVCFARLQKSLKFEPLVLLHHSKGSSAVEAKRVVIVSLFK